MNFYILENEELKAVLSNDEIGDQTPIITANVSEKLTSYDILTLEIPADNTDIKYLKENNTIVYEDIKGYREYIINEVEDVDNVSITRTVTGELSSIELIDEIVQTELNGSSNNPTTILTSALNGTRWAVGSIDSAIYNSVFKEDTKYKSVLEVLDLISSQFNCEVQFSYVVDRGQVVKRQVNLYKQFGENNGKRFEMDKDVSSIKRTIDSSNVKTAIIPLGKIKDSENDALVDIKDLVWSKVNGDPVDKPKGQNYIGHPDALAQWGRLNANGTKRHRFITVEMEVDSVAQLASMAWVQLGNYINPKITYESDVVDLYALNNQAEEFKHEHVNLGDTVVVIDNYFTVPIVVQSRIVEMERNLLDPTDKKVVFGDSLEQFSIGTVSDSVDNLKNKLDEVEKNTNAVTESANGKNTNNYGSDIPTNNITGDLWYRPHPSIPNETQMLIWDGTQWVLELDTSDLTAVTKEVEAVITQADADRLKAEADFESAKVAAKAYTDTKASEFDTKVEAVKTDLAATKIKADKAITDSEKAIADAGFAKVDASTAKQNAVTAISTAETAKTNAATALTNAGTAISTANTAKTNAGIALTTAQTSMTNSGTAITNAQNALDAYNNLEIGGRNLLVGTSDDETDFNFVQNGNSYRISPNNIDTFLKGGFYTVSAEITEWEIGTVPIGVMVSYRNTNGSANHQMFSTSDTLINPKTGIITHTFNLPDKSTTDIGYVEVHLRTQQAVTAKGKFRKMMMSKGTKGTDWTPAPEDVQVQITDINGELSRKVAQTTFDTLNGTVTNQGTQISQSQTAIGLKADKSVVDTINQTVASHTLSIKATADELATKAQKSLVDTLNGTVATHTSQLKINADGLALKADKTLVDTVKGTVDTHTSQIKATSDGLSLKADSSLVNAVKGTVDTHTTQIKATSDGLALKATSSSVDTLIGIVSNQGAQIKLTSDGLALKAEKSLVDSVKGTVDTHTTQITATSNGLALKADSSLVNTINGTVKTHTGQISANSTAIAARLTSAQVDSLVAGKKYVNETTLNATAKGLSTQITQVSTDLSNLEIGGRNYILNSEEIITPNVSQYGWVSEAYEYKDLGVSAGSWITVSFDILESSQPIAVRIDSYAKDGTYSSIVTSNSFVQGDRAFVSGRLSTNTTYTIVRYRIMPGNWIGTFSPKIIKRQLEVGNKLTDWAPALEDMATLEKFTTLEATVNGVQTTVGTKANQSQVTQLATQVSSKVESAAYSTKMTQLDNAINLRVVQGDITAAILADKKIKDTRNDNQTPIWYIGNYPQQSVTEFKLRTVVGVPGSANYVQLTTKVPWAGGTSGGVPIQVAESNDGVYQRVSNSTASAWLAWDKVAEAGKLISQINISTEGILLQGKRIQLDGDVTMTNAFVNILDVKTLSAVYADIATLRTKFLTADLITSTHLKSDTALITKLFATDANIGVLTAKTAFINSVKAVDIAADRITAGTLNAANVNIINLNASKIATGTISGVNSAWNLNTGTMNFKNPSTGDSLTFNQGEIQFQNGAQGRYLRYQSEGLRLIPFAGNTGTSKNTALHLIGGGSGSYQYIQFVSQEVGGIDMRLEAEGQFLTAYHGSTGSLIVAKYGDIPASGQVITGAYETRHSSGVSLRIAGDSISTPRDGSRNIYLVPQGTGVVVSGNASGTRYNMVASDFVKQSTRDSKTDIKPIETKGLDVINRLNPVSYKKKDKVAQGIIETELGFIAEDSLEVATVDGLGIYDSHITAYLVKAVQELNAELKELGSEK